MIKTGDVSGACILLERDVQATSKQLNMIKSILESVLSPINKINRVKRERRSVGANFSGVQGGLY